MTAVATQNNGYNPDREDTQLPAGNVAQILVGNQAGQGQSVYFDASGNVALTDGTVPGLVSAGLAFPGKLSGNLVGGPTSVLLHQGFGGGIPASALANDSFTAADQGVVAWDAGNGVPGKLSGTRSILGLVFGLRNDGTPRFWAGTVASIVARALHMALNSSESGGQIAYAVDASATTVQGSLSGGTALLTIGQVIPRPKRHGVVTAVDIVPSAALAASGVTNNRTVQLWKVDTTGTIALASAALVATFATATQALTAGQPTAFTLGAASALNLLETDILVMTSVVANAGATIPQSAIRAHVKVI